MACKCCGEDYSVRDDCGCGCCPCCCECLVTKKTFGDHVASAAENMRRLTDEGWDDMPLVDICEEHQDDRAECGCPRDEEEEEGS